MDDLLRTVVLAFFSMVSMLAGLVSLTNSNSAVAIYGFVFFMVLTMVFGFLSLPPGER